LFRKIKMVKIHRESKGVDANWPKQYIDLVEFEGSSPIATIIECLLYPGYSLGALRFWEFDLRLDRRWK
jgi:hypothetical protein